MSISSFEWYSKDKEKNLPLPKEVPDNTGIKALLDLSGTYDTASTDKAENLDAPYIPWGTGSEVSFGYMREIESMSIPELAEYKANVCDIGVIRMNEQQIIFQKAIEDLSRIQDEADDKRRAHYTLKDTINNEITRRSNQMSFNLSKFPPIIGFIGAVQGTVPRILARVPSGAIVRLPEVPDIDVPRTHQIWAQKQVCENVLHTNLFRSSDIGKPGIYMYLLQLGFLPSLSSIKVRYQPSNRSTRVLLTRLTPYIGSN